MKPVDVEFVYEDGRWTAHAHGGDAGFALALLIDGPVSLTYSQPIPADRVDEIAAALEERGFTTTT